MGIIQSIFLLLRAFIMGRAAAAVENLALRQQVAGFKQSVKRSKLRPRDRVFRVVLSRLWRNWRSALAIASPHPSTSNSLRSVSSRRPKRFQTELTVGPFLPGWLFRLLGSRLDAPDHPGPLPNNTSQNCCGDRKRQLDEGPPVCTWIVHHSQECVQEALVRSLVR